MRTRAGTGTGGMGMKVRSHSPCSCRSRGSARRTWEQWSCQRPRTARSMGRTVPCMRALRNSDMTRGFITGYDLHHMTPSVRDCAPSCTYLCANYNWERGKRNIFCCSRSIAGYATARFRNSASECIKLPRIFRHFRTMHRSDIDGDSVAKKIPGRLVVVVLRRQFRTTLVEHSSL